MAIALRSLIVLIGLFFAIEATRFAFVDDLVRQSLFEEALAWRADSTEALTRSGQVELALGDAQGAGTLAARAVSRAPLDVAAIRIAGLAAEASGDSDRGETIMRQAMMIGWRDAPTQYWVFKTAVTRSDWKTAAIRADALARADWHRDKFLAALWALAAEPAAARAVAVQLATQPNWRGAFFHDSGISTNRSDAGFALIAAILAKTDAPLNDDERGDYIQGLASAGHYARGRAVWLSALPSAKQPANALIGDPDFSALAVRGPTDPTSDFDWKLLTTGGSQIGKQGNRNVLTLAAPGDSRTRVLAQTTALPPGSYRIAAAVSSDVPSNALTWRITCLPGRTTLIRQEPIAAPQTFTVPAEGCAGQSIGIFSGPVPGKASISDIQLVRG